MSANILETQPNARLLALEKRLLLSLATLSGVTDQCLKSVSAPNRGTAGFLTAI
jgi:hypothetical protein